MTINLAGQAIQDVRVAGVQAQRVMLGTGTTAVEVWSASPYPLSLTWGPVALRAYQATAVASHTMTEAGTFTVVANDVRNLSFSIFRNGGQLASGVLGAQVTWTGALAAGDAIEIRSMAAGSGTYSGTWSITNI